MGLGHAHIAYIGLLAYFLKQMADISYFLCIKGLGL